MNNAKATITGLHRVELEKMFLDALLYSYQHNCEIFSTEKHFNRTHTDTPFCQMLKESLDDKFCHKTILFRKVVNEHYDLAHWEFGISTSKNYINIKVKPDEGEKIIKKYNLEIIKY